MNEIIVAKPREESLIESAKRGLVGELSALSAHMYLRAVEDFLQYAQEVGREAFSDNLSVLFSDYLRYLRETGLSASTVQAKRVQLRRFFEWCVRVGLMSQSVLLDAKAVKSPKFQGSKAGNWITPEQMQALLNAPDSTTLAGLRDRAILAVFLGCGLRRSEVANLTWGQITRYGNSFVIQNLMRKHGRIQAYVPVPDWVMKAIEQYKVRGKDNERVFTSLSTQKYNSITTPALWMIVHKYAVQVGLGDLGCHDLRRSFARAAKLNGLELSQLALVLGHSSVRVTERYVSEMLDIEAATKAVILEI